MLKGANYYMESVKIKAEAKIGKSWAEVKQIELNKRLGKSQL